MNELNIILNGQIVKGKPGESILDLAKRNGITIPTLCHDPRLEPYTSCYVCVVAVEGLKGLQPSCSTRIAEGMKIETHSDRIRLARKTALDLLLSNHYADCVAPCRETCPAGVDVQAYISFIEKGMYHEAVETIKETNPLPAICGRVCVRPCEVACRRNLLDEGKGVGIDYLKRYAADRDLESPAKWRPTLKAETGKKVAVIGAGPGGLSAAFFLRKEGHAVDIFEASPAAGGWLRYGIPEYRLPNDLLQKEVDNITEMGVNIFYNKKLGDNLRFSELKSKYNAFILAIGSQTGTLIGCEGEDAANVFSGIDFLKEMEITGKRYDFSGKTVAVVGGGNTAMDCCRSSIRCGAKKVYVIYRRTEAEMPANPIEIHESKLEGVEYLFLTNPTRVNKKDDGSLKSVTCLRMELGEPDASGRRRPVPVEGSEFDIELDYILAAIGQKTNVSFLNDINASLDGKELKLSRWGDIEADKNTMLTSVGIIFAAGDAVNGPATLIQAVGQAKVAAHSCHQYLCGEEIKAKPFEFISHRDHFKEQKPDDYMGNYARQLREEMPTLDPRDRFNFHEVELGYADEEVAYRESQRCLECGCTAYYDCDLKRYATDYKADQKRMKGEFKEYQIDFRHPFIEIDNNKCILCSRCIRICREVVGANALGLINRGFDTYVAPAMGNALQDTFCESCGMCITACPTAAISENFPFKPGPVKVDVVPSVCNYCSVGCRINYHHKNGFVMKVTTENEEGIGNVCRFGKFGYRLINDPGRITKPLLKTGDKFTEISFEQAYGIILEKIKSTESVKNGFFAGARLTNEELFLIQKLARLGAKTNNINSFHYLARGDGYRDNAEENVPLEELKNAGKFYLIGSEISRDNPVAGYPVFEARLRDKKEVVLVTTLDKSCVEHKADRIIRVKSYYSFIKALNYLVITENLQNQLYIDDTVTGYPEYREALMKNDPAMLLNEAGLDREEALAFLKEYNDELNAVILYSEKELGGRTCREIRNLAMLTGKLGKTANGLVALKEKNNAQGLIDMGVTRQYFVGGRKFDDPDLRLLLKEKWGMEEIPQAVEVCLRDWLDAGEVKNLFIFGEDPMGCAFDKDRTFKWLDQPAFLMVQDYTMTETAMMADLVMPASYPAEIGGSFTNTQKVIQEFAAGLPGPLERSSLGQLCDLLKAFGGNTSEHPSDILLEAISFLPGGDNKPLRLLVITEWDNHNRMFDFGCDSVVKRFADIDVFN